MNSLLSQKKPLAFHLTEQFCVTVALYVDLCSGWYPVEILVKLLAILIDTRFQVLMTVMSMVVFWIVTSALKVKTVCFSEILVSTY
jgi:hypothetical protein